jgi:hypothetical protein
LPSIEISISAAFSRSVQSLLVNWLPWSVLKISGLPFQVRSVDLRLQRPDLGFLILPVALAILAEGILHPVQRVALPLRDHVRVDLAAARQFRERAVSADRRPRGNCSITADFVFCRRSFFLIFFNRPQLP